MQLHFNFYIYKKRYKNIKVIHSVYNEQQKATPAVLKPVVLPHVLHFVKSYVTGHA